MKKFFDDYFNIHKMIKSKKEYRKQMERVKSMPEDYQYVFKEIQSNMWMFVSGAGYDMMKIHEGLIELFEEGISEGKSVLEITGDDVSLFIDELLKNTSTYKEDYKNKLNKKIKNKISKLNNNKIYK